MSKKDPFEIKRKDLQNQLKSAYRRREKLDDKIVRLLEKLAALSKQETEERGT